ncbi:hypothetical protein HPB47_013188 [Ixodes persulcatus]|uniref:Uncharacterized protein n=1 Tax=Ixodes persulcatus TaxID=34615 RepID=A0AC60R0S8_IXOPE|nr:hypothetical protein HPB47_013188 [Ixodes persulcatus]
MKVDKDLAIFPIVSVSLRKRFENEGYMLHLDSPKLTLVRHQMAYLEEGLQEYSKKYIKCALSLLGSKANMDHTADDVFELERRLDEASLPARKFVSVLNLTIPIVNLKRTGHLEWETYLVHLRPGSDKVVVMNSAYIEKLSGILTSTALSTLLNYVGFRILVSLSPFLSKEAGFLVPLSYDDHIPGYYDTKTEAKFTANSTLSDYVTLLNEATARYWRSKDNADYDARYHVSCLRPGFEYNAGRNSLYIPYGVVASQHRASQSTIPAILTPFIVPYLVQGMYEAIDDRGSTMNVRSMPESWWSGESLLRYRKQQRCFAESYLQHMLRFGAFQGAPMIPFIRRMMAENAALQPSQEVYSRALAEPHSMQRNFRVPGLPAVTPDMLFFVNFAASLCDAVRNGGGLGALARRQVQHRVALPSVLRVNVPLRNFDRFAEVFSCAKGSYMNPGDKCKLW